MSSGPPSDLVRLVAVAVRPHAHLSAGVRTSSLTRVPRTLPYAHLDRPWQLATYMDPLLARHRGAAGGAGPHRDRRRGNVERAAGQPDGRGTRRPARHDRGRLPGDHGGFVTLPEQFGRVLDQVLTETT